MKKLVKAFTAAMILFVIIITFQTKYTSLIHEFENEVQAKESQVDRYIEVCNTSIDLLTIYGNDFFLQDESEDSKLFHLLEYNSKLDSFNLDELFDTSYLYESGNITGSGTIPTKGMRRDEINLAFQYFQSFESIHKVIPSAAWIYYLSNNNFLSLYPWVSSEEFAYSDRIKTERFFTDLTPQNNRTRESLWVPVYSDHAGKGLMVTLSNPIYAQDKFMGVVCIDLTIEQFGNILSSKYEGYLFDGTDNMIASSHNNQTMNKIKKTDWLFENSQYELEEIQSIKNGEMSRVGKYFVYPVVFESAPWKMIYQVTLWSIISKSVLYTLPTIIICILFVFALYESEKRKNTALLLRKSLNNLKSYQELLENAAKYDSLTMAYNRRGLQERFNSHVKAYINKQVPISFIICDIDHFKLFNDTYGHKAGDKVLIELTGYIKGKVKNTDTVCRWGGEEFTIMLYNRTYQETIVFSEDIRKGIESLVIDWEDTKLKVTMTFGVVEYNYIDNLEDCVAKADQALYYGKENGRNRVVGYLDIVKINNV